MSRYDRYGERIDEDEQEQPKLHDPRCERGWLGETPDGRPIPCLDCRPHLIAKDSEAC